MVDALVRLHAALLEDAVDEFLFAPEDVPVFFLGPVVTPTHQSIVDAYAEVRAKPNLVPTFSCQPTTAPGSTPA